MVHRQLVAEWQRISASEDPFTILGMSPTATSSQARAAFLQGTRLFHPRRFADDAEAMQLATQIVLARKRAYDRLIDDGRCDVERARLARGTQPP
jgi:curved DNA-binding protein CbpA